MNMITKCPFCNQYYEVESELDGMKAQCAMCDNTFYIYKVPENLDISQSEQVVFNEHTEGASQEEVSANKLDHIHYSVKSIREGKASLVDTFCYIHNGEIWVKGMNISPYFYGSYNNHEARRDRKLLLNKKEIKYLEQNTKHQAGFTIIPVKVYISEKGFAKMDIALAKGKKEYDKRNTYKDKEDRREMDRAIKRY